MVKLNRGTFSGLLVSVSLHAVVLFALSLVVLKAPLENLQMVLDSVFEEEERIPEEITQEVEQSTEAARDGQLCRG